MQRHGPAKQIHRGRRRVGKKKRKAEKRKRDKTRENTEQINSEMPYACRYYL
jgi:hypothetical protein